MLEIVKFKFSSSMNISHLDISKEYTIKEVFDAFYKDVQHFNAELL